MKKIKYTIVDYFNQKEFQSGKPTALVEMIFDDLILLLKHVQGLENREQFFFTNQIDYLDMMWHYFILHTRLYHEFCQNEFGEILHHDPESFALNPEGGSDEGEDILVKQFDELEASLGKDFMFRVFFLYPALLK